MSDSEHSVFLSYAQNFEDVVLWRALGHVTDGRYVDVGAADPVIDSVTMALYERGWRGVHIEPVPSYAEALRAARPGDTVVQCGVGPERTTARFTIVEGTGWSTFDPDAADLVRTRDRPVQELDVEVRTLDEVLDALGLEGRDLHVLKIDVEGYEAGVVAGANLTRWKPWVVLVEATEPGSTTPTHHEWEPALLAAGYQFCLFDGLNRFYVHEDHVELRPALSYPACTFDQPFEQRHQAEIRRQLDESRIEVERREVLLTDFRGRLERFGAAHGALIGARNHWRHAALDGRIAAAEQHRARAEAEHVVRQLADQVARLDDELAALRATVSWRVTAPLRTVRRRRPRRPVTTPVDLVGTGDASLAVDLRAASTDPAAHGSTPEVLAFRRRLVEAAALLEADRATAGGSARAGAVDVVDADPFERFAVALESSEAPLLARAWLGHVVATASFPDEDTLRSGGRALRRLGARGFTDHLIDRFVAAVGSGGARPVGLDPVVDGVVTDVTHTAQHDLQTGIQRVVRETCSRWLVDDRMVPVWWDYGSNVLRRLPPHEVERLRNWRDHLPSSHGTELEVRSFADGPADIVVPWRSLLLLPELTAEPARTEAYRALACGDLLRGVSMIGYDIIPVTAAETVTEAMSRVFSLYLAMVKRSTRLSAISGAAAGDFRAFNAALASQGISGPEVVAHLLPPSPHAVTEDDLDTVRRHLGTGDLPMVLVVGSHEPRKNHLTVLEAAEALWASGVWFDLVFIGGSGWRSEPFDAEVARLQSMHRPVQVFKRATEVQLWASYRLARFSVFPSLVEGFGLPIVESIASGTPVITTNYGSMAEIAVDGGAVLVDPYDSSALEAAMRELLVEDATLDRLRGECRARTFGSWEEYSATVWSFLVDGR